MVLEGSRINTLTTLELKEGFGRNFYSDLSLASKYLDGILDQLKDPKDAFTISELRYNEASYHMMAFDFKASNKASLQALEYAIKDGDKEMIGMCYGLRGSLLRYLNLVGLSISSYNQSLAYAQSHRRKASSLNGLGVVWTVLGDHKKAEEKYKATLDVLEKNGEEWSPYYILCAFNLAHHYLDQGQGTAFAEKVRQHYMEMINLDASNIHTFARFYHLVAKICMHNKEWQDAITYAESALYLIEEGNMPWDNTRFRLLMGKAAMAMGDIDFVENTLAPVHGRQETALPHFHLDYLKLSMYCGFSEGEISERLSQAKHRLQLIQSDVLETSQALLTDLSAPSQSKPTAFKKSEDLKVNVSFLDTHFLSNALASVQHFILKSDSITGGIYVGQFSEYIRQLMYAARDAEIYVEQEIALIEAYLKLEAQRLGFTYKIHVDDVQESFATRYIPSLIVHPIVENAIKHAMGPNGGSHIDVHFRSCNDHSLYVHVVDNGPGLSKLSLEIYDQSRGVGNELIRERIRIYEEHGSWIISLRRKELAQGLHVTFNFTKT
ncbi:MAG: histidine kinase [Chitinophagales bacterium]